MARFTAIRVLLFSILFVSASSLWFAESAASSHLWSRNFGGPSQDVSNHIALDSNDNIYIAGGFAETADFGGIHLVSAGLSDIFLAKYDANGNHLWSRGFGGTFGESGSRVAVDSYDNVYMTGGFGYTVNFGGSDLVSAGSGDIFLAKYDSDGNHLWSQRFGSTGLDRGMGVAVDSNNNVYLIGYFISTVNFGGGNLISNGSYDIVLAKYNSSGVHQWSQSYGGTDQDWGYSVEVDPSDNVIITGFFQETANFGGSDLTSPGSQEIFLAKYNSSGSHQWSQRFGNTGADKGKNLDINDSGDIFLTGYFQTTVNFGGGNMTSAGSTDIFVAKYNSSGVHQWSQGYGGTSNDEGEDVALDGQGNVYLSGYFKNTADFGGGNLTSAGDSDIIIARYDGSNGDHQWSQRFGSTSADKSFGVGTDAIGSAVFTGSFQGTVNFGGGGLTSNGSTDVFLSKYEGQYIPEPVISSILDVGNDQGRQVKIRFTRSAYDHPAVPIPVTQYEIYLRDDPLPVLASEPTDRFGQRLARAAADWFYVGSVPAHVADEYLALAPTLADSTIAEGMHYSVFFIRAATGYPAVYYDSPPDSGYSLDNLAPGAPLDLAYNSGILTWEESSALDFDYFAVYGSNINSFNTSYLIDNTVQPALDVSLSPYAYYFVSATDFSGNEGDPATVDALTNATNRPQSYPLSIFSSPNPFNPSTTVHYTVPGSERVTVVVYSISGNPIRTLVDDTKTAGSYTINWDGRDDQGNPLSSGVYFVRISQGGFTRSNKIMLLK